MRKKPSKFGVCGSWGPTPTIWLTQVIALVALREIVFILGQSPPIWRRYGVLKFSKVLFMVALWNRADHYIFLSWLCKVLQKIQNDRNLQISGFVQLQEDYKTAQKISEKRPPRGTEAPGKSDKCGISAFWAKFAFTPDLDDWWQTFYDVLYCIQSTVVCRSAKFGLSFVEIWTHKHRVRHEYAKIVATRVQVQTSVSTQITAQA